MRVSVLFALAFLCCVTAAPNRAELRVMSGCSLRAYPKLSEAVVQPALNRFKNLDVSFDRDEDMYVRLLEQNREVERVPLTEDAGVEEVLALLRARGLVLVPREGFVEDIKDDAALAQYETGGDRFVLFQVPALRAVGQKLAEKVKGQLATFASSDKQKAVSAWLKAFPQVKTVHTGAFFDDAMFFWDKNGSVLPSRDRGRFPWAKGEPAFGNDCVVLEDGLLRARPCNALAHVLVQWTPQLMAKLDQMRLTEGIVRKSKKDDL